MTGLKSDWRVEGPQLCVLALMFLAAALAWPSAPDQIPVHWNVLGQVDRYGGKAEGLLPLPIVATGLYVLLRLLPKMDPEGADSAAFGVAFDAVRVSLLVMLAIIYGFVHLWLRGERFDATAIARLMVAGLFIVLGNWLIGMRTPGTLSRKNARTRTIRFAGWFMVLLGAVILGASAFGDRVLVDRVTLGGLGLLPICTMAYSYWAWRTDPDNIAPAGTQPGADR